MNVKRILILLNIFALAFTACTTSTEDPEEPVIVDPEPEPQPDPEPEPKPQLPTYKDVTLHSEFKESFSEQTSRYFDFSLKDGADDFRYYPAFPSWNEKGTDLLMLRISPEDPHGMANGTQVKTKDYTFYGSYSIRVRMPNAKAVQPNVGANVTLTTLEEDETNGFSQIGLTFKLADPSYAYTVTKVGKDTSFKTDSKFIKDPVTGFSPTTSYVTYGFDWHKDKVQWWVLSGSEKKPFREIRECIPLFPARFMLCYHYSSNTAVEGNANATKAPLYPFELEVDSMSYTPFEDEIKEWHNTYFNK